MHENFQKLLMLAPMLSMLFDEVNKDDS